ncbi:GNAT family N-acetyltransferase [Micromonospora sp. NPDC049559]|uniref:GNAT family N-acetyltransferase n=1 Tax=Micromonospora sp. NPDC049559 TaxID=3155923 RepID=UPI0034487223
MTARTRSPYSTRTRGAGGDTCSTAPRGPGLARELQERAARALPVTSLVRLGGWWLRHGDGSAWWASSVLPHGDVGVLPHGDVGVLPRGEAGVLPDADAGPAELPGRIRLAEEFYSVRAAPARFQITPGACPADLDAILAGRGYRVESPMSLQSAPAAEVVARLPPGESRLRLDDRPTDAWFAAWLAVHGGGADAGADRDLLSRVDRPAAYVSALDGDEVVAVGRAVHETGWAGIFGMATLPYARGRGAARQVLAALARWAARHGAGQLYLQVEPGNTAARRLYERSGFTELCRYHYRTAAS